jgi:hypothetical protein
LSESFLLDHFTTLKEVAVCITFKCSGLYFSNTFYIRRDKEANLCSFEIFDTNKTGVIVHHLQTHLEISWTGTGQGE